MSKVNIMEQAQSDPVSQDQILDEDVKVRCSNSAQGCEWTGTQIKLNEHLKSEGGCLWADVECPNRCVSGYDDDNGKEIVVTVKRKSLKDHLEQECLNRPYECECGMKDTYSRIVNEHQMTECCEWFVDCENRCNTKMKRKEVAAHQHTCPELIVECPFVRIGCDIGRIRQGELIAHLHLYREQHDLYSKTDNEDKRGLKAQVDQLKAQMDQLKAELKNSKQKLAQLIHEKSESERKFRAIATDIGIMRSGQCDQRQELALTSVETQLETKLVLDGSGKPLVLRVPRYSGYQQRGQAWHSQQFSACFQSQVYKMFISVFPRGIHLGAGTHISLKLCCVCSEHHEPIPWPKFNLKGFICIYLMSKTGNLSGIYDVFENCSYPPEHLPQQNRNVTLCTIEKFATVEAVQENVIDNSIALIVQHNDFVVVEIPAVAHN